MPVGRSGESERREGEDLGGTARGPVCFTGGLHLMEVRGERDAQALRRVAGDIQTAAPRRSVLGEGRDDRVPTGSWRVPRTREVTSSVGGAGEEMEYRAVMTDVDRIRAGSHRAESAKQRCRAAAAVRPSWRCGSTLPLAANGSFHPGRTRPSSYRECNGSRERRTTARRPRHRLRRPLTHPRRRR